MPPVNVTTNNDGIATFSLNTTGHRGQIDLRVSEIHNYNIIIIMPLALLLYLVLLLGIRHLI